MADQITFGSVTPVVVQGHFTTINLIRRPTVTAAVTLLSGSLPPGLPLVGGNRLQGTPSAAGTYTFTLQTTSPAATQAFTIHVFATTPPVHISANPTFAYGVATQGFNLALDVGGGTSTTWALAVTSGSLPTGMNIASANGTNIFVLGGTPSTAGVYQFTLTATGNMSDTGTQIITLAIYDTQITGMTLPPAQANVAYSFNLSQAYAATVPAAGGGPWSFYQKSGSPLPAWLSVSAAGLLHGTPATGDSSNDGNSPGQLDIAFVPAGTGPFGTLDLWVQPPPAATGQAFYFGSFIGFFSAGEIGGGVK